MERVEIERRMRVQERELERIREQLEQYLTPREARQVTAQIGEIAVTVDREIDRIWSDPLVREFYRYNGRVFTARGSGLFQRAFDGTNILETLTDSNIDIYFWHNTKAQGIHWMMKDLDTHVWEATVRRMNWEEEGSLSCLSRDVIEAILEDVTERRRLAALEAPALSEEERAFFRYYEAEVAAVPAPQDNLPSSR